MKKAEYLTIFWLCVTTVILIALQSKLVGFVLLVIGLVLLWRYAKDFRKNIALIYLALAILGVAPINTNIYFPHSLQMGVALFLVVFIPYYVTRYIYKNHAVRFPLGHGRQWQKKEILYVFVTAAVAYLVLPFMLRATGSYHNWHIQPGFWNIALSYIGLNAVGIWDELFFVSTVLGILRKFLPFKIANLTQAVIFTSFLYTLGFQGWSPIVVYAFALSQGYIFKKTDSLLYVLTIHLTLDLALHLTLVYLHYPAWLPFFIT
jgi:membrane protease YdiL (CAAX protease family)